MTSGYPVRFGTAALARDLDRPRAWLVDVDGVPQSYVDLDDPTYLEFEYLRGIAHMLDCLDASRSPLTVAHLGGAACTLPRYVAATRPGSRQVVFEPDGPLVDLVLRRIGAAEGVQVHVTDGREGLAGLDDGWADVVVTDAFVGSTVPRTLRTAEFIADVARVLRPGGTYVHNLADVKPLSLTRRQAATVRGVLDEVAVLAEAGVLRGRRLGNVLIVGSDARLPVTSLSRRLACEVPPVRLVVGEDLDDFVGRAEPFTDGQVDTL